MLLLESGIGIGIGSEGICFQSIRSGVSLSGVVVVVLLWCCCVGVGVWQLRRGIGLLRLRRGVRICDCIPFDATLFRRHPLCIVGRKASRPLKSSSSLLLESHGSGLVVPIQLSKSIKDCSLCHSTTVFEDARSIEIHCSNPIGSNSIGGTNFPMHVAFIVHNHKIRIVRLSSSDAIAFFHSRFGTRTPKQNLACRFVRTVCGSDCIKKTLFSINHNPVTFGFSNAHNDLWGEMNHVIHILRLDFDARALVRQGPRMGRNPHSDGMHHLDKNCSIERIEGPPWSKLAWGRIESRRCVEGQF